MNDRISQLARSGLFAIGVATSLMGAYHLYLPTHMQWEAGLDGVPGMIRWGLFAINSDLSILLVLIGIIACIQSLAPPPRSTVERVTIFLLAGFWLWHQFYIRIHPMPIPDSLNGLRLALEAFGVVVLIGALACPLIMVRANRHTPDAHKRAVCIVGLLIGTIVMGTVVGAVLISISTLKGSAEPNPQVTVHHDLNGDADRLGVPELGTLSSSKEFSVFHQADAIEDGEYLTVWPDLHVHLGRESELNPASDNPSQLNLYSRYLMQSGDLDAAARAINRAIELEPDQALHRLQLAMVGISRLDAEQSPMKCWAISRETQTAMESALALNPSIRSARLYLVYALDLTPPGFGGDPSRAMRLLDEAIELGHTEFRAVRARLLLKRGEYVAGTRDAIHAMNDGVYHPVTFALASQAALQHADLDRASQLASFAIRMAPEDIENWKAYSAATAEAGDHTRAATIRQFIQENWPN